MRPALRKSRPYAFQAMHLLLLPRPHRAKAAVYTSKKHSEQEVDRLVSNVSKDVRDHVSGGAWSIRWDQLCGTGIAFAEKGLDDTNLVSGVLAGEEGIDEPEVRIDEEPVLEESSIAGEQIASKEPDSEPLEIAITLESEAGALVDESRIAPKAVHIDVSPAAALELAIGLQAEIQPVILRNEPLKLSGDIARVLADVNEKQRIAETVEEQPLSEKSMVLWLDAVSRISSSSEKKSLLIKASHKLPDSEAVQMAFINASMSMSSSSDKLEPLLNLLIRSELTKQSTLRFLETVRSLPSMKDRYGLTAAFLVEDERFLMQKDDRIRQAVENVIESMKTNRNYESLTGLYNHAGREINKK